MTDSSLLENLLKDFQEQKKLVNSQIAFIDPLATSIRQPVATRLLNESLLVIAEIIMWLLFVASIAFIIFMDKIGPFFYLKELSYDTDVLQKYRSQDLSNIAIAIKGLALLIGLLSVWIARMLTKIRLKNSILQIAGRSMKQIVEQLFQRKAEIEALENRFPSALPSDPDSVFLPPTESSNHNDILL